MDQINCIAPDAIEEADLWAYLEGMAPDHVAAHIHACEFCQQVVQGLIKTDLLLHEAGIRLACPDTAVLWQYANEPATVAQPLAAHIHSCVHCQAELGQIRRAIYVPHAEAAASVTPSLYQKGKELIRAVLVPASDAPALAFRGQAAGPQIYQAAGYQIMIAKIPDTAVADSWQVEGQIMLTEPLPDDFQALVILQEEEVTAAEAAINPVGYFALDGLKPGMYTLQINLPTASILIPDFQLG